MVSEYLTVKVMLQYIIIYIYSQSYYAENVKNAPFPCYFLNKDISLNVLPISFRFYLCILHINEGTMSQNYYLGPS